MRFTKWSDHAFESLDMPTNEAPASSFGSRPPASKPPHGKRSGKASRWIVRSILLFLALAGIVSAAGYGPSQLIHFSGATSQADLSTYTVERGDLLITLTEDGDLESAANIDVKCQVAGGSSILWIVPEGTEVKKGDKLVELDAAAIEDQMNTQRITYNKAKAAVIQAEKNYEVAKIAVKEYLEGTYVQELEAAETQITIAEENLRSAKNSLDYSERMFQRGYISQLELESQQFSVKRAELELNSARTARRVLEEFTKAKMMEDLQSQLETAKAAMESEEAAFELEEAKLKRLETQIANCVIVAPQDGMAVYANERRGRGPQEGSTIEEGAAVRDRQSILKLPDLSQMQVKVAVHETKVEEVQPGMRARINIQGREYQGTVISVANQPERTNWFEGNVKEYAAIVKIDGTPEGLKPGMTAEVEILIAHLQDVISLPVATVVEQRNEFFCWVKKPDGSIERRKLLLGLTNDQFVEVKDGVVEGEQVVRNPRVFIRDAQAASLEDEQVDVEGRFGNGDAATGAGDRPDAGERSGEGRDGFSGRQGPGGAGFGGRGGGRGGGGRGGRGFDPMQLDEDGDGKISRDEAPEPMQNFFSRIDANGDGFLDEEEISAMRGRGGRRGGGGPPDGSPE